MPSKSLALSRKYLLYKKTKILTLLSQITSGLVAYSDSEKNAIAESLVKTIQTSKQYWSQIPAEQEEEEKPEPAKLNNDIIEDHDVGETPMGEWENDEEDQILSVSINKVADLEKINNPEITHLEIVS